MKGYVAANAYHGRGGRGRSGAGRLAGWGAGDAGRGPGVSLVAVSPGYEADEDYAASAVKDSLMICSAVSEEGDEGLVDFEHDDHADIHVLSDINA